MTLPKITPAHQAFNNRRAQAEDRTTKYIVPLYGTNEQHRRYGLGSGVLLQIADEHFLISAAHVFDENKHPDHPTNIEIPGKNQLIPIGGQCLTSPLPSSGKRADDTIDIAVVHLDDNLTQELLAHFTFLDITQVDPSDKPFVESLHTFTGYPSTKQKPIKNGTLTIEPVRYTSSPLHPDNYPKGYALGPHHAIDYDKKTMVARNEAIQTPPDPHGVSGGGLFRLGTYDEIATGTNREVLVGIAIEDHKTSLIATNIAFALEMIRAHHPNLAANIPTSEYLGINAIRHP